MAVWTATPYTAVAGAVLTAAVWNAQVKDLQTAFGAFGSYTVTLGGFTIGNGSTAGRYSQVSKTIQFMAQLVFGTTTTAATAIPTLTAPVTSSAAFTFAGNQRGLYFDASSGLWYNTTAIMAGGTATVQTHLIGASGVATIPTTTTPFTWTTSDTIAVMGTYEAA